MASNGVWTTHIGGFCRAALRVSSLLLGLYNRAGGAMSAAPPLPGVAHLRGELLAL
jgi:hypothetical protein